MKNLIKTTALALSVLTVTAGMMVAVNAADVSKDTKQDKTTTSMSDTKFNGRHMFGGFKFKGQNANSDYYMIPGIGKVKLSDDAKAKRTNLQNTLKQMKDATKDLHDQMTALMKDYRTKLSDKSLTDDQKTALKNQFKTDAKALKDKITAAQKPYLDQIKEEQTAFMSAVKASLPADAQKLMNDINSLKQQAKDAAKPYRDQIKDKQQELKTILNPNQSTTDNSTATTAE